MKMDIQWNIGTCKRYVFFVLVVLVLCSPFPAHADLEIGEPFIRNFEPEEYGGYIQVWAIAEDHRGVMFFGTTSEILEFDGTSWRRALLPNNGTVRSLAADGNGTIFVGGVGEIGYLAPDARGKMEYMSLRDRLLPEYRDFKDVNRILTTSHGVYFFTKKEIFRFRKGGLSVMSMTGSRPIQVADKIYIYTEKGLATISEDGLSLQTEYKFDVEIFGEISLFPFPSKDRILAFSERKGLYLVSLGDETGTGSQPLIEEFSNPVNEYLIKKRAYTGTVLGKDRVAIGTERGVVVLDTNGDLVQVINKNRGLLNDDVFAVEEDRFHNLWVGSYGGISYVHTSCPMTLFGENSGLPTAATAVTRYKDTIYAGTRAASNPMRLPKYKINLEDDSHRFVPVEGTTVGTDWSFLEVEETLLVVSDILNRIDDGKMTKIEGVEMAYGMCLSKKHKGRIYVGFESGFGLIEYRNESDILEGSSIKTAFEYKGKYDGVTETIRAITEDSDGGLWLSTHVSGLIHVSLDNEPAKIGKVKRYTTEHGLPSMDWNKAFLDDERVLTSTGKGIFELKELGDGQQKDTRFVPEVLMNEALGNPENGISEINPYGKDRWLIRGENDYEILMRGPDKTYRSENRPFRALTVNQDGIHIDANDVVWILADKGLCRYDPSITKDYETPFAAIVRNVRTNTHREVFGGAFYESGSLDESLHGTTSLEQPEMLVPHLEYEENGLTFEYSALYYEHMDETTYKTKLEGFDEDWSDWSKLTLKEYTNVPEGKYTLRVIAKNIYDTQSSVASYHFEILPPWYRTWYAFVVYALCFFGVMYGGIQFNTRRLIIARKRLELIVKKRTREIKKKKDELEIAYHEVNETKNALWGEMELARKIQTVLLPKDPRIPDHEITGYMQTADEVGGDYYDVINAADRNWLIIGDVSGHGVTAGLVMMMVQTAINHSLRIQANANPEQILAKVNETIYENIQKLGQSKYMTLTLMSFETDGTIFYSGLHQDILVYRRASKTVEIVETNGIWLGITDNIDGMNTVDKFHLEPGDTILLYTDGIVEATDAQGAMFDDQKLIDVLEGCGGQTTDAIRDCILKSLVGYTTDDDVTMLLVKRKG